jgi:hypothetical protein
MSKAMGPLVIILIMLHYFNNYDIHYKQIILPLLPVTLVLGIFSGYFWYEIDQNKGKKLNLGYLFFSFFILNVICAIISLWFCFFYGKYYLIRDITWELGLQWGLFAFLVYIFRSWKNKKYLKKDSSKEDTIIF